jgi:hypothetical protein
MFIGHFALAFGAKKLAPKTSLGVLFMAAQLADLIWPTLVLLGIEKVAISPGITAFTPLDFVSYPYSHSLVALIGWALALAIVYLLVRRGRPREAFVLALLVLSHWVLDVISHRPDMPIALGGGQKLGLGLWNSIPATLIVEGLLFAAGIAIYLKCTSALDRIGKVALWALVGFLAVVYSANVFGPPPPSVLAVAWVGESIWLLVAWAWWADRHRRSMKE